MKYGRDRSIILHFYNLFQAIITNDQANHTIHARRLLKELSGYRKTHASNKIDLTIRANYDAMTNKIKVDLTETIKGYILASKKYQIHKNRLTDEELKKIYIKKVSEYYDRHFKNTDFKIKLLECLETDILPQVEIKKDLVLKQALMEINNALSHLNSTIHGINETEDNIDKAKVHIQRATLDCYKAIIKDLTFLNKTEDRFTEKLKELRYLEYTNIK